LITKYKYKLQYGAGSDENIVEIDFRRVVTKKTKGIQIHRRAAADEK